MLADHVRAFVLGALPAAPARVLEVGAGEGELAAALAESGYEVVAIDPAGEPPVVPVALLDLDERPGSFDAGVAVVSLHHLDPLEESLAKLGRLLRPGATLVVDEFDVGELDERAAAWWISRRCELGHDAPESAAALVEEMRGHIHRVSRIYELLAESFELSPVSRGSYLHRWHLDPALRTPEEDLIASGELPATGARFTGRRRERS